MSDQGTYTADQVVAILTAEGYDRVDVLWVIDFMVTADRPVPRVTGVDPSALFQPDEVAALRDRLDAWPSYGYKRTPRW